MAISSPLEDTFDAEHLASLKANLEAGSGNAVMEFYNHNSGATLFSINLGALSFTTKTFGTPILVLDGAPFSVTATPTQAPESFRIKNRAGTLVLNGGTLGIGAASGDLYVNDVTSGSPVTFVLNDLSIRYSGIYQIRGSITLIYP